MKVFIIKAILNFPDGVNKGQLTIKAGDPQMAKIMAIEKLVGIWKIPASAIDILSVVQR